MAALRKVFSRRFASLLRPPFASAPAGRTSQLRRFPLIQQRPFFQPALPPDRRPAMLAGGDVLAERIRGLSPGRICLDGLLPPPPPPEARPAEVEPKEAPGEKGVVVEVVRKVIWASRVAAAQASLRATRKSCITYPEFLQICCEASNDDEGPEIARSLDQTGIVIVHGNFVFLKPEEVLNTIENMMRPALEKDPDTEELRRMEEKKAVIDQKAAALVRKELWCGLGFMVAQTAALMRWTFWDLSWDVMEPICFYITSLYFFAGYGFFLRTSKEPSFESFFATRFATKQKKLMEAHNFDVARFNQLAQACRHPLQPPPFHPKLTSTSFGHCDGKNPSIVGSSP